MAWWLLILIAPCAPCSAAYTGWILRSSGGASSSAYGGVVHYFELTPARSSLATSISSIVATCGREGGPLAGREAEHCFRIKVDQSSIRTRHSVAQKTARMSVPIVGPGTRFG